MLLSANDLQGLPIHAVDGGMGKADDFYFDDRDWKIRYLIADLGTWFESRRVLISPDSILTISLDQRKFVTSMTKEQVAESPDWDSDKPVSRRYEALFAEYFGSPYYWSGSVLGGGRPYMVSRAGTAIVERAADEMADAVLEIEESHLHSIQEIKGYNLEAKDREIGKVNDFLFDDQSWEIHYLVIDIGKWFPGPKVLISPHWIDFINWSTSRVGVQLDSETIKHAPVYNDLTSITNDFEKRLFAYYERASAWAPPSSGREEIDSRQSNMR